MQYTQELCTWFELFCAWACINFTHIFLGYFTVIAAGNHPDSKVHVAYMGPTWVLSAPGGPHVGPMNLAIWVIACRSAREATLEEYQ